MKEKKIKFITIVGMLIVRKLAKRMFLKQFNLPEYVIRSFAMVLAGSMAAFVASWETGYLLGKITGTIEGLDLKSCMLFCFRRSGIRNGRNLEKDIYRNYG